MAYFAAIIEMALHLALLFRGTQLVGAIYPVSGWKMAHQFLQSSFCLLRASTRNKNTETSEGQAFTD